MGAPEEACLDHPIAGLEVLDYSRPSTGVPICLDTSMKRSRTES